MGRACFEIANCPQEARVLCKAWSKQESCWISTNGCRCPLNMSYSCNTCPIYVAHREDLERLSNLNIKRNRRKLSNFLKSLEPIVENYLPQEQDMRPVDRRRKRMIKRLAIQILQDQKTRDQMSLERNFDELLKEIYNELPRYGKTNR